MREINGCLKKKNMHVHKTFRTGLIGEEIRRKRYHLRFSEQLPFRLWREHRSSGLVCAWSWLKRPM